MKDTLGPRIGQLFNGEYYAYANGHSMPEVRGTLKEVEISIGLYKTTRQNTRRKATASLDTGMGS